MNKTFKILRLLVAAFAFGAAGQAKAVCDGCVTGAVTAANLAITTAVTSGTSAVTAAVSAASTSIVAAVNYATQSPSSMLIQEIQAAGGKNVAATKTLMEAQAELAKAQSRMVHDQMQNLAADTIKVQAIENSRPVAGCSALNAVVAARAAKAGTSARAGGATANQKVVERLTTSVSPQAAVREIVESRTTTYGPAAGVYQNADITAGAFFNGANESGKTSLTFNVQQKKAAEDFTRNVVAQIPEPRLDPQTERTPQGQAYVAMHSAMTGKKSVVVKFFNDHVAERDPAVQSAADVAGARERARLAGYAPANLPSGPISYAQLLELEANHRYMGKKWFEKLDTNNNEAQLLKSLAEMQAFQLHLLYLQMQEMQQMRAVMSVAANELVEMNSAPKLAAQRDAAIKTLR